MPPPDPSDPSDAIDFTAAWLCLGERMESVDAGADGDWVVVGGDVAAAYASTGRHYHARGHVLAVLEVLDLLCQAPTIAQQLAAFVHDIVYDPQAEGYANEEASAVWAEQHLPDLGVPPDIVAQTAALTRATAGHELADAVGCGEFLDADLSILGTNETTYDRYARQIRQEYAHVPDDAFRQGRAAVLQSFLNRYEMFFSPLGKSYYEARARANMSRELARLEA